jgi:adenylyltransferase/sulfurtransferase
VKLIVGIGDPLVGRLMVHEALRQSWEALTVLRTLDCALCGESPTVTELVDYQDFCGVVPHAGAAVPLISARELADLLSGSDDSSGVVLVDVRGKDERSIVSIPGARAVHLDEFRSGAAVLQIPSDQPVVIHCKSGSRSEEASRILIDAGHPDVRSLEGGVLAWVRDVDPSQPSY